MPLKEKFTLEERPETDVYVTDSNFIGIRQIIRGEETVVLLTADETVKVIDYLKSCVDKIRKKK